VFERMGWEDWIVFVRLMIRVSGGFLCTSVISNKVPWRLFVRCVFKLIL